MASTYKTPGVYVEEISTLPPSVATVDTAVPAFIGYTERASKNGEDRTNKPTKIYSLTEYEQYFGAAPSTAYNVYADNNDAVTQVTNTLTYYLYDSLRMFYDNGGGKCYIVSVGNYSSGTPALASLITGLDATEKEDEPTMIVCPDATLMTGTNDLYSFQQKALKQCGKLMDRVAICDVKKINEKAANETLDDRINEFRDQIGINDLKYGAAYAPYLRSSLARNVRFRDLNMFRGGPPGVGITFDSFTSDNGILQMLYDLVNAKGAVDKMAAAIPVAAAPQKTFQDRFKTLFDDYNTPANTDALRSTKLSALYDLCATVIAQVADIQALLPTKVTTTPDPASKTTSKAFTLRSDIDGIITSSGIAGVFTTLCHNHNAFAVLPVADRKILFTDDPKTVTTNLNKALLFLKVITPGPITDPLFAAVADAAVNNAYAVVATTLAARNELARKTVAASYSSIIAFYATVQTAAAGYEKTLDDSMASAFGYYKTILEKVKFEASELPPSGAVAGIYAQVDNTRGVWKAPANVSISSVLGPTVPIDNSVQDGLNVDANAGKSVNVIRAFTGKGTLIWGARTLAGNDNEWRYISVRRFYNFVEESVKKSTSVFVFEPNDANTWVKIKGMIENFLTNLWRQGALAGAKPEHAFFVKVGLGLTMTSVDILEGRLNVEIGMAVVRPAEFIILKFSHKMQES
jgi:phage tail sheath protein FI